MISDSYMTMQPYLIILMRMIFNACASKIMRIHVHRRSLAHNFSWHDLRCMCVEDHYLIIFHGHVCDIYSMWLAYTWLAIAYIYSYIISVHCFMTSASSLIFHAGCFLYSMKIILLTFRLVVQAGVSTVLHSVSISQCQQVISKNS